MLKRYSIFICVIFILLFISCERNKKETAAAVNEKTEVVETNEEIKDNSWWQAYYEELMEFEKTPYAFTDTRRAIYESRKTMYVVRKEGLAERLSPSVNGEIIDNYRYCEKIEVYDRSEETVTIDGITDYWYKIPCYTYYQLNDWHGWYTFVFGGHIAEKIPSDAPITKLNGIWLGTSANEGISCEFSGDTYNFYYFHGEMEEKGNFKVTDTHIIFNSLFFISYHFGEGWKENNKTRSHTYNLSGNTLKMSEDPIESDKYRESDFFYFEKHEGQ